MRLVEAPTAQRARTNAACWREAQRYLVGGVNSPVRSFRAVGGSPLFVDRGEGSVLWDVEGNRYLDYIGSWGALILGHRHPAVTRAIEEALARGTTFGAPTPGETDLAREITEAIPSVEQIRFVSSGTGAVMSAIRLARAATGRRKILKFDGAYHGHLDSLLAKAGSGMFTLGIPSTPGIPESVARDTVTIPFNDPTSLHQAIRRHGKDLACAIAEPVLANVGVIPPDEGFLQLLRARTKETGALLIFDEVITGFRVSFGGAQALYGISPDLTILGKIIGGGFPIGAYGGKRRLMRLVAPSGPVYQAGTLSGHPVAMAAGLATLQALKRPRFYDQLGAQAESLSQGLLRIAKGVGIPIVVHQAGGLLSLFFGEGPIRRADQAKEADSGRYSRYFRSMLKEGICLPPSAFEAWFVSAAHGSREISMTLQAHEKSLRLLRRLHV